jgi:ABC-type molybdate transport system ATPase subunit
MEISARNVLKGKVVKVVHGMVSSEITIELPGDSELVSVITMLFLTLIQPYNKDNYRIKLDKDGSVSQ